MMFLLCYSSDFSSDRVYLTGRPCFLQYSGNFSYTGFSAGSIFKTLGIGPLLLILRVANATGSDSSFNQNLWMVSPESSIVITASRFAASPVITLSGSTYRKPAGSVIIYL